MKLRIDRKHMSQPAGGFGYTQPDGPVLSDEKLDGLIKKIKAYREANGLPHGDPEHDVATSYAARCPWLIMSVEEENEEINEAEAWIHATWRSFPLQQAETRARDERFTQCTDCIHSEPLDIEDLSTEACRRLLIMNPHKARSEHFWCTLRGWVPSVAVQIHDAMKLTEEKAKIADCWVDPKQPKL